MLTWTADAHGDWIAGVIINGVPEYSVYQTAPSRWRCLWSGDTKRAIGKCRTADEGKLICQRHDIKRSEPRATRIRRLCCDSPKVEGGPHAVGCRHYLEGVRL